MTMSDMRNQLKVNCKKGKGEELGVNYRSNRGVSKPACLKCSSKHKATFSRFSFMTMNEKQSTRPHALSGRALYRESAFSIPSEPKGTTIVFPSVRIFSIMATTVSR